MKISATIEHWPFTRPFHITGHTFDGIDVLVVTVESDGVLGRGEAAGVYYHGETPASMAVQVEALSSRGQMPTRADLLTLMEPGGARNAVDCALWDFEARKAGTPAWRLAGLSKPRPLLTTYTIGADTPQTMAEAARSFREARALKLKLVGDGLDMRRVVAVRDARPDAWMGIDANQGFSLRGFMELLPTLVDAKVQLIEQPFPVSRGADLDGLGSPIPIALDESVQDLDDLESLRGRCDVINIKLDKCGGLTRALQIAAAARRLDLGVMVGNMIGTSLSVAPAFLLGQICDLIDLDGPLILARDRPPGVQYRDGYVSCPKALWGSGSASETWIP